MTTLRERIRDYWRSDEFPANSDDNSVGTPRALLGSLIVIVTGVIVTSPLVWLVLQIAPMIGDGPAIVLGLALFFVSGKMSRYIGAPLADHVLGIPREVPT